MSSNVPDDERPIDPEADLPPEPVQDDDRLVPLDDEGNVIEGRSASPDDE
ncbi:MULTISPECIES: hypothetical protein [unclassified Microbacterium]|nr:MULTISPECIES: hypothetical protein [unclassified Microbacterium]MCR2785056.1 hypothetical protein [Microbacterium sp. zg.B96]MDL5352425.1 hypothetical protein [Microbacterium sp. zg-YB36]WIM16591.1 hypothetical protein QNO11_02830 [Microbacterium sp. zg-B96]